jgi:(1->4)-alpha-D-glucan 1-alpha-D-glucosylmutase
MTPEPIATYRLQLCPELDLDRAAEVVPYLAALGVSHVYASPYLQAARGSVHGYDVVDPTRVNEELGGEAARRRLCAALAHAGLGQMLDIVPNHMAILGGQNPWWWDVLENGHASRFASYFDVDWDASEERWPNKILLPVLPNHYGRILEAGELRIRHANGAFTLHGDEQVFPLDPSTLGDLLGAAARACGSDDLGFLAESCARLPRPTVTDRHSIEQRHRDKGVVQGLLTRLCCEDPRVAAAIDAEVERRNADPDALDALIDRQNYRLAFWRTAGRDLGYRRFFDIHDLAGLRIEDEEVFHAVHALPIAWVRGGSVHGLRIDHVDGLRNPAQYLERLRAECPETWIVVEKILEHEERLSPDWPVEGTTGYELMNRVDGLFVDPRGEAPLTQLLCEITGETRDFATVAYESKRQVLEELLGSELARLVSLFVAICETHRRHRDYTRHELYQALLETAACFPVYRTYVRASAGYVSQSDARSIARAIERANENRAELDPELFQLLQDLLLLRRTGPLEGELAMRFQQLTGPAMAKGVEDTAFYRYHRLVSANEVGGDPGRFGESPQDFHEWCRDAQRNHPYALLASSTHDTKRSADVRARIVLLSEIPIRWADAVRGWIQHNERHRQGEWPDRATEYLLYQTLVGTWPVDAKRVTSYMEKAMREAKVYTSWTHPRADYEEAVHTFVVSVLEDARFRESLERFVRPLVDPGCVNALAQTLIAFTAPGVPDLYQGMELWNPCLVDPDNRRAVDFARRAELLGALAGLGVEEILARWNEGLPKLHVIHQALRLRRRHPHLFGAAGSYDPALVRGERADHAVAFVRSGAVAVLVPRLGIGLAGDWRDTAVEWPRGRWINLLTADTWDGGWVHVADLLRRFPVALLHREEDSA